MIVIIDYNAGNTCSVMNALKRLNVDYELTDDPEKIKQADKVIFPGVGHAKAAMDALNQKGLVSLIKSLNQPLLGICLGMQLLCANSEEANTNCLNILPLDVFRFNNRLTEFKVPHMGWNTLSHSNNDLFAGLNQSSYCYFVHSYYVPMSDYTICSSNYMHDFSAAVKKDNFVGVQFHPEKSGKIGEQIIKNFLES